MLCCLLAGVLAFVGMKGHRRPRTAAPRRMPLGRGLRLAGFGLFSGALAFEVVATVVAGSGGITTVRPGVVLLAASAFTLGGALLARYGGVPNCRRAWAVFTLGASAGSALAELIDLHALALHRGPDLMASLALHGLAIVPGILASRLLMQMGEAGPRKMPVGAVRRGPLLDKSGAAGNS
jgi:hypothetical protein